MARGGLIALAMLAACSAPQPDLTGPYLGIETRLLQDDLVQFELSMTGSPTRDALVDYADCAAAQYALIRGQGFARHIRTTFAEEGGIRRADAVYTISSSIPAGIKALDAEVIVADCQARDIPTV